MAPDHGASNMRQECTVWFTININILWSKNVTVMFLSNAVKSERILIISSTESSVSLRYCLRICHHCMKIITAIPCEMQTLLSPDRSNIVSLKNGITLKKPVAICTKVTTSWSEKLFSCYCKRSKQFIAEKRLSEYFNVWWLHFRLQARWTNLQPYGVEFSRISVQQRLLQEA